MAEFDVHAFYDRYIAVLNAREFSRIPEFVNDPVTVKGTSYRPNDVIAALTALTDAIPDFTWRVEDLVAECGSVAVRLRDTGTPVKTWLGLRPTGSAIDFTEMAFYKVRDGRFVDMWPIFDFESIQARIGG